VSAPPTRSEPRLLVPSLLFIALVVAAVGSLGAPLITSVATTFQVSLASAQWTLTIALLTGAIATPLLGRLGAGPHRRGTILVTLGVVVAGSTLTVLPLPFAWLLVGRGAQGVGLGLTALMMGVARDYLPEARGAATIALISVASTIGIGVGYPLAGLLTELGGVRAAYGLGVFVTAAAFMAALRSMPSRPQGAPPGWTCPARCCWLAGCSSCCSSPARRACGTGTSASRWPWRSSRRLYSAPGRPGNAAARRPWSMCGWCDTGP